MNQPTTTTINIVLADDHDLVRSGIAALLDTIEGVRVVAEARNGEELLAILKTVRPHLVITDISMPGMDGITAARRITEEHPGLKVIVLSMHDSVDAVKRAVANGACGYLRKDAPQFELEQAVRSVVSNGSYFGNGVAQMLLQPSEAPVDEILTGRQLEVLTLLAQGKSAKEIAFELGLSSKTVDVHRAKLMERLQLSDLASLTRYAVRKGLVKV
jgi:two-component system, NarL family, nitrate/nitrite response regulator NarL